MNKKNKNRILNAIVDIVLFVVVFGTTDALARNVFHSESIWLELGVYLVLYAVVFGAKSGIVYLWKNRK